MKSLSLSSNRYHARGAVLFVALVFLVIVTLLGLTAVSTSVLQERMTGGLRNDQLALMGAETAVRNEEWVIWNKSNNTSSNKMYCGANGGGDTCYQSSNGNTSGVPLMNSAVNTFRTSKTWLASDAGANTPVSLPTSGSGTGFLQYAPRFLVEELGKLLPPGAPGSGEGGGRFAFGGRGAGSQTLYTYRITGRATGGSATTVRVAESYFVALPPSF